jgi:hypothetical protein
VKRESAQRRVPAAAPEAVLHAVVGGQVVVATARVDLDASSLIAIIVIVAQSKRIAEVLNHRKERGFPVASIET